jgi:hypothetical protein
MEFLKVMEKFDGGNFHLWKFNMCMMFSKHGHWKFVDGSVTIPNDKDQITNYNEKATKAFALLCEHSQMHNLHTFNIAKMSKALGRHFCSVQEAKTIGNKLFLQKRFFTIKWKKGKLACAHQHGEGACKSITFH